MRKYPYKEICDSLTPTQRMVFDMTVVLGMSTKEQARLMNVSTRTIECHRHNILSKFKEPNFTILAFCYGVECGESMVRMHAKN